MKTRRFELVVLDEDPRAMSNVPTFKKNEEILYLMGLDGDVVLLPASEAPVENPFALFTEWESEEDEKAFANL